MFGQKRHSYYTDDPYNPKRIRMDSLHPPSTSNAVNLQNSSLRTQRQGSMHDGTQIMESNRVQRSKLSKEDEVIKRIKEINLDNFAVITTKTRGRGVITKCAIEKGTFLMEYQGELVHATEGYNRDREYQKTPDLGSFLFFFHFNLRKFCIDATKEDESFGRLINHALDGNVRTVPFRYQGKERIYFVASEDIEPNQELFYDYGDRNRNSIKAHPWLRYKRNKIAELDQQEATKEYVEPVEPTKEKHQDGQETSAAIEVGCTSQNIHESIDEQKELEETRNGIVYTMEENYELITYLSKLENQKRFDLAKNLANLSESHRSTTSVQSRVARLAKKSWRNLCKQYNVSGKIARKFLYIYGKK